MPSHLMNDNVNTINPLQFLAQVALHSVEEASSEHHTLGISADQKSPRPIATLPPPYTPSPNLHNADLHIGCSQPASPCTPPGPFKSSNTLNNKRLSESPVDSRSCMKSSHQARRSSRVLQRARADIKAKRKEHMIRALRINTLDNSPVNSQQYAILRMVYNEITMYPSEPWMVLIALVIHRSLKQVKNWFSNERQKQKAGEVVSIQSDIGEKLRLRPPVLDLCQDWSDSLFEGILRIYHFTIIHCQ